jgi:lipoprotein
MKMSKYIILILSFLMILTITSCKKEQDRIEDNYNFILNVEKQNAKIAELGKTITNQQLIYLQEDSSTLIYVKYNFTENISTQKIIYRFFNDLDEYRLFFNQYDNFLDGNFLEVNEEILMIATTYQYIDKKSFSQLYDVIHHQYVIIE